VRGAFDLGVRLVSVSDRAAPRVFVVVSPAIVVLTASELREIFAAYNSAFHLAQNSLQASWLPAPAEDCLYYFFLQLPAPFHRVCFSVVAPAHESDRKCALPDACLPESCGALIFTFMAQLFLATCAPVPPAHGFRSRKRRLHPHDLVANLLGAMCQTKTHAHFVFPDPGSDAGCISGYPPRLALGPPALIQWRTLGFFPFPVPDVHPLTPVSPRKRVMMFPARRPTRFIPYLRAYSSSLSANLPPSPVAPQKMAARCYLPSSVITP